MTTSNVSPSQTKETPNRYTVAYFNYYTATRKEFYIYAATAAAVYAAYLAKGMELWSVTPS